ncbi:MAG: hypothetical protein A3J09_01255 [Candidatus Zambryskibacteria bacterium RIFCSPLOWO2_02_FULL_51_21]|uniref:Transglycosylase SLT domain-containing protein n=1 Tax=Candidatus Zambryskibacteria bacterium RIFCSPHIGHO2_02_FULL_43_37 TaxID=1802749 RepID=A0A1G2THM8_9BACT|nr:MAG: hypothetical protein A2723_01255 [Candidatus Zambryskibacteria bacterium RIFCSPHIGHO2_01_FULL_52_18]OHA96558.1 MAG: hypothetical protein A3D49_01645 [Candidatus Zambryskibacteria bacterium RIFCSPHIGHO2_02_FULL_43_37]OHB07542.1 MAG: hypothetical protein A2944_01485 [Candidatus Zambryskibacteria bacterium RIFCSPLOWO2_01_FULL_52_12]OHB11178.1 MAG: hypothetical protein A3J09_01255 [Candidatus Zambryskibacteria bacterium RIFCSPLOWO2_02_FULL_51_21]
MNKITSLAEKFYRFAAVIVPGAFLFGLFQFPVKMPVVLPVSKVVVGEVISSRETLPITEVFFGADASAQETKKVIDKQVGFVSSRNAYPASLAVIQKHEKIIREKARKYGVPEDVAIGVGLLENGGSDTAVSSAGALGVFQLMPGTARSLGLTVNKKVDERKIPEKNIDAGMRYLALNYYRFGDWGLATWAYHAGEGNVAKAVQLYAKAKHGVTLPGVKDPAAIRAYADKHHLTIHELLSSSAVKTLTRKLNDDSSGYPYKVIATATLFKEAK